MKLSSYLCIFVICLASNLSAVVVLVHGSFSSQQSWWRHGGDFFKVLEIEAKKLGHTAIPFSWSGDPSEFEMTIAAHGLCKVLKSYPSSEEKIIIGHSHGGNIINYATVLFAEYLNKKVAEEGLQAVHLPHAYLVSTTSHPSKPILGVVQGLDTTLTKQNSLQKFPIDAVYLLGTPVTELKFVPEMSIIGRLVNLYSEGDCIQEVLGLYGRRYPLHERLTNIRVSYRYQSREIEPGHAELHAPFMASWLLQIPFGLTSRGVGNFGHFRFGVNAHIVFDPENYPTYYLPLQLVARDV